MYPTWALYTLMTGRNYIWTSSQHTVNKEENKDNIFKIGNVYLVAVKIILCVL